MVHDGLDRAQDLVAAVALDQFEKTPLAGLHRRDLRAQIAHGAARQPHVLLDHLDQRLVGPAAIVQFQDRDLQAFGENIGGDAAERAADIEPMRHAAGEADQHVFVKDRQRQRDVIEVAAGEIGIVGDVDVARPHVLSAEMPDLRLDRFRHAADEHRQPDADGDGLALGGEQAGGEIERLVDDDVVGGAHEVGFHFLGHRDHAVAHDLGDDRIGFGWLLARVRCFLCHRQRPPPTAITRLPNASTSIVSPGISTVVEAYSSIRAGPLMRLPASNAARRKVGVA